MANMTEPENIKPPLEPMPVENVAILLVCHPVHNRVLLELGCRTQRDDVMVMSRPLVEQAATIVAQTEGFLSRSRDRAAECLLLDADVVIPADAYYFHAKDPALCDYVICAEFDAWEPPTRSADLPEPWRRLTEDYLSRSVQQPECTASDITFWVKHEDDRCILKWAEEWSLHLMAFGYRLPPAPRVIDDVRYLARMNRFTHALMDSGLFCPFVVSAADGTDMFVAYFFSNRATASGAKYHMRALSLPLRISPFALYVRFAWTVFNCIPQGVKLTKKPLPDGDVSGASSYRDNIPSMIGDFSGTNFSADDLELRERNLHPKLLQIFSDVEAGKIEPPAILYEYALDYPGMTRIARLREEYIKEHPQVFTTADTNTLRLG
ncbi:hypothetical protein BDZ89DRAFT_1071522 [Hymenopellis radicata]|nr:hypothetical protein BDZ89DRAFT_1071522 [Hymenopellis radicata]